MCLNGQAMCEFMQPFSTAMCTASMTRHEALLVCCCNLPNQMKVYTLPFTLHCFMAVCSVSLDIPHHRHHPSIVHMKGAQGD